jgi:serine/threonine-protein phosphatase 6 regulatory ankyrin repeat subunit B
MCAKSIIDEKLVDSAYKYDVNAVRQALKAGANPNSYGFGQRSLVETTLLRMPTLKGEIFKRDEDKKWAREEEKKCIETLTELFNAGAKAKQLDLYWPIERNSVLILKLLLKQGLDPNASIKELTPIEVAVKCNSQAVVDFLIGQGVKPVPTKVAAQLSLLDAAENNDIIRMERALSEGAKLNCVFKGNRISALLTAVYSHNFGFQSESYGAIAYLLQKGANPNFKGPYGNTPLHEAMFATKMYFDGGSTDDRSTAQKTYRSLSLQALVKAGANVSSLNDRGETPLHFATTCDNLLGAKFLIENGTNINLKDQDGKTPLYYAKSEEMINLLKSHGAKEG